MRPFLTACLLAILFLGCAQAQEVPSYTSRDIASMTCEEAANAIESAKASLAKLEEERKEIIDEINRVIATLTEDEREKSQGQSVYHESLSEVSTIISSTSALGYS